MRTLLATLARFAIWVAQREAARDPEHRNENDSRDCLCDACGWVRGIEDDADAALDRSWR